MQPKELLKQMKANNPPTAVDVRTIFEFRRGHIPGVSPRPDLENTATTGSHPFRQEYRAGSYLRAWSPCPDCQGIAQDLRVPECGAS